MGVVSQSKDKSVAILIFSQSKEKTDFQ